MGLLRKVTGKTVSRKDATAQRKTFLYFDLILNHPDGISATEISSRLNKCKKGLTGQVGQAG